MTLVGITGYRVAFAAAAQGYDGWRASIAIRTQDPAIHCQVRFVDDPAARLDRQHVDENGDSTVFVAMEHFASFYRVLQSERPLYLTLAAPPVNSAAMHSGYEKEESR